MMYFGAGLLIVVAVLCLISPIEARRERRIVWVVWDMDTGMPVDTIKKGVILSPRLTVAPIEVAILKRDERK
jgi:hypothetical protein